MAPKCGSDGASVNRKAIAIHHPSIGVINGFCVAGVDRKLNVVEGGPHAFETFAADTPTAKAYLKDATNWLKERLGV